MASAGTNHLRKIMTYYFSKIVESDFDAAVERAKTALEAEGFGVLTEIDVKATLKKKLDVEFRPYLILGACNPNLAHQALQLEDKVGTMLPCNVIVQQLDDGRVEIAAVDPMASMQAIDNARLGELAGSVRQKLKTVVEGL
jgi:uncharacterized protein (DUF302 family)